MTMHKTQRLLIIIRPIQFFILLLIIALEIVQLVGFSADRGGEHRFDPPNVLNNAPLSNDVVPWYAYFEDFNSIHGVKIFYFIVILFTLVCPQFFWKKFNRADILSRDKYYEFLYFALWISVCFTNLEPSYEGTNLNCDDSSFWRDQGFRCKAYLSSVFFGFLMAITWAISTIALLGYINKHKDELADKRAQMKKLKKEKKGQRNGGADISERKSSAESV